ncbi:MAG: Y-family DNA polymerase [Agriterribacter sp.]
MAKRFVSVWFRHLSTDGYTLRQPQLKNKAFVLSRPDHGRMIVSAVNALAQAKGITAGMAVADARALFPGIEVLDDQPALASKLLTKMAEWCIRFSPFVAVDLPDGLLIDASGCTHLWGGDTTYLADIYTSFKNKGYTVRVSIADTAGAAWAIARYGKGSVIVEPGKQPEALLSLPPEALRLEAATVERLYKLGLNSVAQFIHMPRHSLQRRFGKHCIMRIEQALGAEEEWLQPVIPVVEYQHRLPCLEPITTAAGIEIALKQLLLELCGRLQREQKGLRQLVFKCYRIDGHTQQLEISTNSPSHHAAHLFKLLEIKLPILEPDLGFELFVLEALGVQDYWSKQEQLWSGAGSVQDLRIAEMIDRIAARIGAANISRYLPDEHYLPERSVKAAASLNETITTTWRDDKPRPIQLLTTPEPITVTAPVPDYPPMSFRYKGVLHTIKKADGPERIEQEWWLQRGQHRDYYAVEDAEGRRYWLFRLGHYEAAKNYQWFMHGFFA